jgi:integration host factor subunit beta
MTKSGLIEEVARRTPHISKKDTEVVVNTIFDSMVESLKNGDRIEIRGFGSFQVKVREARDGRNPKTGEPVHISAKRTPFFKVGKELKEMVDRSGKEQGEGTPAGWLRGRLRGRTGNGVRLIAADLAAGAPWAGGGMARVPWSCCVVCCWGSCSWRC